MHLQWLRNAAAGAWCGAAGGARQGLLLWRSALRADSAAMLASQGRLRYRRPQR